MFLWSLREFWAFGFYLGFFSSHTCVYFSAYRPNYLWAQQIFRKWCTPRFCRHTELCVLWTRQTWLGFDRIRTPSYSLCSFSCAVIRASARAFAHIGCTKWSNADRNDHQPPSYRMFPGTMGIWVCSWSSRPRAWGTYHQAQTFGWVEKGLPVGAGLLVHLNNGTQ